MPQSSSDSGVWTDEDLSLLAASARIQSSSGRLSCLAALGLGKSCVKVYTKLSELGLLQKYKLEPQETSTLTTTTTTTTMTVISTAITTAVAEQSRPSSSSRQSRSMSIESSTAPQNKSQSHVHMHKKRKTGYTAKSSKKEYKADYPADCSLSADNEKRSNFRPCEHSGPCTRGCPCVDDQVHCEKSCCCPPVFPF
jgi:hypothetical protein